MAIVARPSLLKTPGLHSAFCRPTAVFFAAVAGLLIALAVVYHRSLARQPRLVRVAVGLGLGGAWAT